MDLSGHHQDLGMPAAAAAAAATLPNAPNLHDSKMRLVSPGSSTGAAGAGGTNGTSATTAAAATTTTTTTAAAENQQDSSKHLQMIHKAAYDQIHHHHGVAAAAVLHHNNNNNNPKSSSSAKIVRYRECLKNHAAGIGGHALDGCGEFMPSGEEGSIEALKCAACDCHRNFHKREVEGEPLICDICHMNRRDRNRKAAAIAAGAIIPGSNPSPNQAAQLSQAAQAQPPCSSSPSPNLQIPGAASAAAMPLAVHHQSSQQQQQQQRSMNLLGLGRESLMDHHHHHHHHHQHGNSSGLLSSSSPLSMKKRFRTKFSMDQKEKMFLFAEKLGWRIQKHDEAAVQQFCADVGVKRHVLKVWMHNNKHTFGKRSSSSSSLVSPGGSGTPDQSGAAAAAGGAVPSVHHLQGIDSPPAPPPASI